MTTSKHGTTIFFSHYNLFLGKLEEKLARKARINTERVYRIVLMPPELIQYGRRIMVKRSIYLHDKQVSINLSLTAIKKPKSVTSFNK